MRSYPLKLNWSFRVGRIFGIDVKVHFVFLALLALLCLDTIWSSGSLAAGAQLLFFLLLLFGFVLLHELGHSLAARWQGIRVVDITLWLLGGLARLDGEVDDPKVELKIAFAGPLVNLALAPLFYALYLLVGDPDSVVLSFAYQVNLLMGLVNLVPAFPLDGGRILRALAAKRMPFVKATQLAVTIGRVLAVAGIVFALLSKYYFWVIALICLFVMWAGSMELRAARVREAWRRRGADLDPSSPVIDAEVVSAQGENDEGNHASGDMDPAKGDPDLKSFERDFIDMIRRYKKGEKGS